MTEIDSGDMDFARQNCSYGDDVDDLEGIIRDLEIATGQMKAYEQRTERDSLFMWSLNALQDAISDVRGERDRRMEMLEEAAVAMRDNRRWP